MIVSNLSSFHGSKPALRNQGLMIDTLDFKSTLAVNKVRVGALQKMPGNQDQKLSCDITYICIDGLGSVEVHGKKVPIRTGDIVSLRANEEYVIVNDSLNENISLLSIFHTK